MLQIAFYLLQHMVLSVMETFCKMLRLTLIPHTVDKNSEKNSAGCKSNAEIVTFLPSCLRCVRNSYSILIKLDLPSEALDIIFKVILDLRIYCMVSLFKQTEAEVKQLHKQEIWKIEFTATHNGITSLVSEN